MKTWAMLVLASACLRGAELVPIICPLDGIGPACDFAAPGSAIALLGVNLSSGPVESGPEAVHIHQTATVDFSAPSGWLVTQITAFGNVQDNGVDTSVGAYFTGPCGATFFENSGTGASCGLTGVSSGTLTATINVIADVTPRGQQPSFGIASIAQFQFGLDPVSIPEPALWPVVLIGLLLGVPRLRYCRASSRRRSSAAIVSR